MDTMSQSQLSPPYPGAPIREATSTNKSEDANTHGFKKADPQDDYLEALATIPQGPSIRSLSFPWTKSGLGAWQSSILRALLSPSPEPAWAGTSLKQGEKKPQSPLPGPVSMVDLNLDKPRLSS
jgi:hypothetical protein